MLRASDDGTRTNHRGPSAVAGALLLGLLVLIMAGLLAFQAWQTVNLRRHLTSTHLSRLSAEDLVRLVRAGADANTATSTGRTVLMAVAESGTDRQISELVGRGAHINQQSKSGWTALMCAVDAGKAGNVAQLMRLGADPDITANDGTTAYSIAQGHADSKIVTLLGVEAQRNATP